MPKQKISATVDPERLAVALALTGDSTVSAVLDAALLALIDRERERAWLAAHDGDAPSDLPGEVEPDLTHVPWEA